MREILLLIAELSKIPGVVFVGSTSLFIQGKVGEISDIDILVKTFIDIENEYSITMLEEPVYKEAGRERAYFIKNNIMVDIFKYDHNEETITLGEGTVCSTIGEQIRFFERILNLNPAPEIRQEIIAKINFLESIR